MKTLSDSLATEDIEELAERRGQLLVELIDDGHLRAPSRVKSRLFDNTHHRAEALHTGPGWSVVRSLSKNATEADSNTQSEIPEVVVAGVIGGSGLSLIDFVGCLGPSRQTGVLTAANGETYRSLYFYNGDVVWASTTVREERLGEFFLQRGKITRAQLDEALADGNKRVGQACVERGFLAPHELWTLVQAQLTDIFDKVIMAIAGVWTFSRVSAERLKASQIHLSTQGLLMDALSRVDEMQLYRTTVPSSDYIVDFHDAAARTELESPEARSEFLSQIHENARLDAKGVIEHIEAGPTIQELVRLLGKGEFEITRAVYHLLRTKKIRVMATQETGPILRSPVDIGDSTVEEIVHAYSVAIRKMFGEVGVEDRIQDLHEAADRLISDNKGPNADFFKNVIVLDDGSLDEKRLLGHSEKEGVDGQQVNVALSELLFFVLFQATEYLGRKRGDELGRKVKEMLGTLSDQGG